ncbi:MAG: DnaJ domain-containing protein [Desulfobacterales bacterium]
MKILLTLLAICYTLSPYDILPDFIVGLGWLDDLIILFLLWRYFYAPLRMRSRYANAYQKSSQSFYENKYNRFSQEGRTSGSNSQGTAHANDPRTILGVGRNSSRQEIKTAYKNLALKYHPDRVMHLGEEFRKLAEKRFKDIQMAYQELRQK